MIKQNVSAFRGQATDLEIARMETRNTKRQLVEILAKGVGKSEAEVEADISRPRYFTPAQARTPPLGRAWGASAPGAALSGLLLRRAKPGPSEQAVTYGIIDKVLDANTVKLNPKTGAR